jgi:plasmid stability protein
MNATIRNLDENAYRALRERAAAEGRTVGDLFNEAICAYLARVDVQQRKMSLRDLQPERFPEGNERLSMEIDAVVYGAKP